MFQEWRQIGEGKYLPISVGIFLNQMEEVPAGMAYDRAKMACDAIKDKYSSSFNYYSNKLSESFEEM